MWKHYFIIYYLLSFKYSQNYVWAFNIETDHYAIYRGGVHSMFGFSVAEYRDEKHHGW
jgi:Zn-dependent M28 family amino/carboxypeptidase